MKKALFTILLFMTFVMADAILMQEVYHKDYGVIDRTVLVFNRALDFKVDHHDNVVEILLPNCSRDEAKVSNKIFTNSNIFKSFTYKQNGNNLLMTILLNDDYATANNSEFSVEYLSFQQNVYKIAIDIFATSNPASNEELLSFINFYTTMNQELKAKQYKEKLTLKIEQDKQRSAEQTSNPSNPIPQEKAEIPGNESLLNTKTQTTIKMYIIPIMIIILVGLLIWLIIHVLKQGKKAESTAPKELSPVGREEFRTRVIRKLLDHDWNKRIISLELKVPISEVEEVERKYQLERATQLENGEVVPEKDDSGDLPMYPSFAEHKQSLEPEQLEETKPELEKDLSSETENIVNVTTPEKPDDKQLEEQDKLETVLQPGEVKRDSDGADEPVVDESLKAMLEYDSSDNPKSEMTNILENVKFSTDDIEDIHKKDESIIEDADDKADSEAQIVKTPASETQNSEVPISENPIEERSIEETSGKDDFREDDPIENDPREKTSRKKTSSEWIHQSSDDKFESAMSRMLRKRFPKTDPEIEKKEIIPNVEKPPENLDEDQQENHQEDPDELLEKAITNKLDKLTEEK